MSLWSRSQSLHEAPEGYDALEPRERVILQLWDDGIGPEVIAVRLKISVKTVGNIVSLYDDREDPDHLKNMRLGSEELRDRILQFHPHVVFGGESHV